jgi:hypothetical protein
MVSKATEFFLGKFNCMLQEKVKTEGRNMITVSDIEELTKSNPELRFLYGA